MITRKMSDVADDNEAPFSFGVTVAFTLNYIIGTGFLTLPWGFNQTGKLSLPPTKPGNVFVLK